MLRCEVVRWNVASALLLLGLGCESPVHLDEAEKSPFEATLEDLASDDPDRRIHASGRLSRQTLTLRERLQALTHAALQPAADTFDQDVGAQLVHAIGRQPDDDLLEPLERLFDDYSPLARESALELIGSMRSRAAAETWMRLVIARLGSGRVPYLATGSLDDEPRHPEVFLPTVLQYIDDPQHGWNLALLGLHTCKSAPYGSLDLSTAAPVILARYQRHYDALRSMQSMAKTHDRFEDDTYAEHRAWASLLIDVMGCFQRRDVDAALRSALGLRDSRLKYFALSTQLRQGAYLKRKHVTDVASNPETRAWLFEALRDAGRVELMPSRYLAQAALAESELVRWLIRPKNLGRAPDQVVLEDVVELDTHSNMGIVDYYVFRFRVSEPHWAADRGWMAGVAGGYRRDLVPTTESDGQVFSRFESIDARGAEDHVGNLDALYQAWREGAETYDYD